LNLIRPQKGVRRNPSRFMRSLEGRGRESMPQDNVSTNALINSFISGVSSRYAAARMRAKDRLLKRYLSYLKELVKLQGTANIRVRDVVKVAGRSDHSTLTRFGLLLSDLEMLGLARRWNASRPKHYTLQPEWLWKSFTEICDYRCETDGTLCSLYGVCPYHRLLNLLAEKEVKAMGGGKP